MHKQKHDRLRALRLTLPVMCGYLFLGTAFGAVLAQAGFGPAWALAASTLVYAGSLQFVMAPLMAAGTSLVTVALTALMVNARHLFYGLSYIERFSRMGRLRPYMVFSLTDETYSVFCGLPGEESDGVMVRVALYDQLYWVAGATMGGLLGALIPLSVKGLGFAMTAMFIAIFLDHWRQEKEHVSSALGVVLTLICLLLFGANGFLLPAMAAILLALTLLRGPLEKRGGGRA